MLIERVQELLENVLENTVVKCRELLKKNIEVIQMSRILLKKVDTKNEKYKELKASIIKQYISSNQFEYDIDLIFECSESILIMIEKYM